MVMCQNGVVSECRCVMMALCHNGDISGSVLSGYVIYGGEQTDDRKRVCSMHGGKIASLQ